MDIREFIVDDNHSDEFLFAIEWLQSKIGNVEDEVQVAWVQQYKNLTDFEEKLSEELYEYAKENSVDYSMFSIILWDLMEQIYARQHGFSSDEIHPV